MAGVALKEPYSLTKRLLVGGQIWAEVTWAGANVIRLIAKIAVGNKPPHRDSGRISFFMQIDFCA